MDFPQAGVLLSGLGFIEVPEPLLTISELDRARKVLELRAPGGLLLYRGEYIGTVPEQGRVLIHMMAETRQAWPETAPCVRVADRWSITEAGRAALREAGLPPVRLGDRGRWKDTARDMG